MTMEILLSNFVTTWWTPICVAIFLAILAYAFWPGNHKTFADAAKMPLRED